MSVARHLRLALLGSRGIPARYGGYEMPIGMMVEVAGEIGRGCGSSAWIFSNLAVQNWIIGHAPTEENQKWWREATASVKDAAARRNERFDDDIARL